MEQPSFPARSAEVSRETTETSVHVRIALDGEGRYDVATGIGFLDHMLELFARHGRFDLSVKCEGDLHVDDHHTVEDVGITLGQAFRKALGDKSYIARYGAAHVPMD
ncbi:MAG TPA: imidazoleglycerol-phosphate dehydratase, partial [Rhodothermales bacterium]